MRIISKVISYNHVAEEEAVMITREQIKKIEVKERHMAWDGSYLSDKEVDELLDLINDPGKVAELRVVYKGSQLCDYMPANAYFGIRRQDGVVPERHQWIYSQHFTVRIWCGGMLRFVQAIEVLRHLWELGVEVETTLILEMFESKEWVEIFKRYQGDDRIKNPPPPFMRKA